MRTLRPSLSGMVMLGLLIVGGGVSAAPDTDVVPVIGSEECTVAQLSYETVDGVDVGVERFSCTDEMTDPRVSGSWVADIVSVIDPDRPDLATWTIDEMVVTNDGGTWRGTGEGVVDLAGATAVANGVGPFNYGVVTLVGEDGYEGLRYQGYLAGTNYSLGLAGRIEPLD